MPEVDCLRCTNSACCREYEIWVDREEYERFQGLGLDSSFVTATETALEKTPGIEITNSLLAMLDFIHQGEAGFARARKKPDGYCVLLGPDMLCTIYEYRPKCCAEYTTERCEEIRWLV